METYNLFPPCLFCGGDEFWVDVDHVVDREEDRIIVLAQVVCNTCQARGPVAESVKEAVKAWQQRELGL